MDGSLIYKVNITTVITCRYGTVHYRFIMPVTTLPTQHTTFIMSVVCLPQYPNAIIEL